MSFQFFTTIGYSLFIQSAVGTDNKCPDMNSVGQYCADTYKNDLNDAHAALGDAYHAPSSEMRDALRNHLEEIVDDTQWVEHWQYSEVDANYCFAIEPIKDRLQKSCLCELHTRCGVICTKDVETAFSDYTTWELTESFPAAVNASQCNTVLGELQSKHYDTLCKDTTAYRSIYECANPTGLNDTAAPSPIATSSSTSTQGPTTTPISNDNEEDTSSTTTTTTSTTSTSTTAPISNDDTDDTRTTSAPSADQDTNEISTTSSSSIVSPTSINEDESVSKTTEVLTTQLDDEDGYQYYDSGYNFNYDSLDSFDTLDDDTPTTTADDFLLTGDTDSHPFANLRYGFNYYSLDSFDTLDDDTPTTTADDFLLTGDTDSHPFANLLLVSLIILGFCVFVAWYAKKNQMSPDLASLPQDDEDNGYLWGLNKSSPSSDAAFMKHANKHNTKHMHEQLFTEDAMTVQMTTHNNDLLAITPDHIGRLQTRTTPATTAMVTASGAYGKKLKAKKLKTRRQGKGGAFQQLADDDEACDEDDDEDEDDDDEDGDSETDEDEELGGTQRRRRSRRHAEEDVSEEEEESSSGEDMMKMRDQFMAQQTFSKRLVDTLGDISDTMKNAVKTTLRKKEKPAVVPPMQIGAAPSKRVNKKRAKAAKKSKQKNKGSKRTKESPEGKKKTQPFVLTEDNETTDALEFSSTSETGDDEYRDDPETEVRMNVHGKRIKQPMKLPTFDKDEDDDEEEEEEEDDVALNKQEAGHDSIAVVVQPPQAQPQPLMSVVVDNASEEQMLHDSHDSPDNGYDDNHKSSKKQKKKKEKRRRKKKDRNTTTSEQQLTNSKMEEHNESPPIAADADINISINNDANMGFGSDDLNDHVDHAAELTKEEEMNAIDDLERALMDKYSADQQLIEDDDNNNNNNPLSFMVDDQRQKSDEMDVEMEMGMDGDHGVQDDDHNVAGNGNVPPEN
eukprot:CAMPEP_0202726692 /NCGR_PEP_ID=MMETSP1385-20130828/184742_1 /ASSEMBLY_ACC=CAM_ASM_000861 /TAXON_ID=933848 /ORGANISM="Elphidium margaritaceum" /LENGTH=956 /DNA_ID=CAMNT_0049392919 /DNA_START=50 /DNA_END=2920 /DNA_ORIENTATION=-